MEIVVYAAISIDGYISTDDGDSDWVLDDEIFEKTCNEFGCIAMGHTTFSQYQGEIYPMEGVQNIVLASQLQDTQYKNVHFVTSVKQVIVKAGELGFDKLLVIGGAKTNESFIKNGEVSGLYIDLHPLTLGSGKKLFGHFDGQLNLKLLSTKQYPEGFAHLQYALQTKV